MPVGFESFDTSANLQLSSDLMAYAFKEKGTRLMNQTGLSLVNDPKAPDPTNGQLWTYPPIYGPDASNQLIQANADDIVLFSCATPLIYTNKDFGIVAPATNVADQTLNYWVFSPIKNIGPTQNFGMQFFNENSELVFDINLKPLILTAKVLGITLTAGMNSPLGLPSGRTYAAYSPASSTRYVSTGNRTLTMSAFKITNDVYINEVPAFYADQFNNYYGGTSSYNNGSVLVFDVTGY